MISRLYTYIFARVFFAKWNRFIFHLSLHGLGVLNYRNAGESGEMSFLRSYLSNLNPGSIVIDVGANEGSYSKMCLEISPSVTVYAFEPHPKTFQDLQKNLADENVELVNMGMGHSSDIVRLFDYAESDGSSHASIYREAIEEIRGVSSVSHNIGITTVDNFLESEKIEQVLLLKIDTEGHELSVLQGARNSLKRRKIQAIHFEFNEMNVYSGSFFRDFFEILEDYDLYRLLPSGMLSIERYSPLNCEIFAYQNIVAIIR